MIENVGNDLMQMFKYRGNPVRTFDIDGESWFVGNDVCACLELKNPRTSLARLKDKYKRKYVVYPDVHNEDTLVKSHRGGPQEMTLVNESALYKLIFVSRTAQAEAFQDWVTDEVLPELRKNHKYELGPKPSPEIICPEFLRAIADEMDNLKTALYESEQRVEQLEPKAEYHDQVLQTQDLITVTAIAKEYGMSAINFNKLLCEMKIQFKRDGMYMLYQEYADKGYVGTKTHVYVGNDGELHNGMHMYWTQKGRYFIHEKLKGCGILPISERKDGDLQLQQPTTVEVLI